MESRYPSLAEPDEKDRKEQDCEERDSNSHDRLPYLEQGRWPIAVKAESATCPQPNVPDEQPNVARREPGK
jgi:hypothetical protein